jgi:hypothetical protein
MGGGFRNGVMKETDMRAISLAVALSISVLTGAVRAEDVKAPPSPAELLKALAEAGTPGPEHKKLEPFVGDFTVTLKLWTDPSQPPAEVKATVHGRWIMGGRFVQQSLKGECNGKSYEGLRLLGYDKAQKKFSVVQVCGLCGTSSSGLATASNSGTRFEYPKEECCPVTGQKITGRDEILVESNDRIVTNVFRNIDGKEVRVIEVVAIRQK